MQTYVKNEWGMSILNIKIYFGVDHMINRQNDNKWKWMVTLLMIPSFLSAKNDKFTKYIGKVTKTEGKNWEALAEPMKWSSWERRDRKNLVVKD